jgi:hypothetical protein
MEHLDKHIASVHEKRGISTVTFALKCNLNSHIASVHEGKKAIQLQHL